MENLIQCKKLHDLLIKLTKKLDTRLIIEISGIVIFINKETSYSLYKREVRFDRPNNGDIINIIGTDRNILIPEAIRILGYKILKQKLKKILS